MSLFKDIAVVLRRLDYSETSQVLAVLTRENGQQRLIAKGIKRSTKNRAATGIDLLELGRVVFTRRPNKEDALATLTEWRQEENFSHLRRDLGRCYAAQYAAEVTSHLTEVNDPHPGLFDALRALLDCLRSVDAAQALTRYLWQLFNEIGLRPEVSRCMSCGRSVEGDRIIYFSSREGGAICRDCEPAIVEKRRIAPAVRHIENSVTLTPTDARSALEFLDYHVTETMGRPAKLSRPMREALFAPHRA